MLKNWDEYKSSKAGLEELLNNNERGEYNYVRDDIANLLTNNGESVFVCDEFNKCKEVDLEGGKVTESILSNVLNTHNFTEEHLFNNWFVFYDENYMFDEKDLNKILWESLGEINIGTIALVKREKMP